ncbi:MAG TPA: alpha-E domain-containing protein [Vicinamibacteria bacterium]
MLSRVAESLYWMARYVERAEDLTRALAVHFQALLDAPHEDAERGWTSLLALTGDEEAFGKHFDQPDDASVCEFFILHPANANAILSCIARARENARAVRDQISSEMWEHLNRLYFAVKDKRASDFPRGPYEFYRQTRDGSQAFQGITHATMTHGEAYHFIQLGKHLERATQTVRLLGVRYAGVNALQDGTAVATLQLIAMLKSCSAFEPFRQTAGSHLAAAEVVEFLLLHRRFPRAVLCSLANCAEALQAVASATPVSRPERPRQTLGKLCAELEYLDIHEVLGPGMDVFLDGLVSKVHRVGDEIASTYFSTQVILPKSRGARRDQQQQQQQ